LVHQGRLPVVDVGDDGDVAQVHLIIAKRRGRDAGGRWS
jgi:hypothetical protein